MALATIAGMTPQGLVPKPIAQSIFAKVQEDSIVTRLAGTTPVPIEGTSIVVQTGHIEAGVVGETGRKPVGGTEYTPKSIKPIKVAAIAIVSTEVRKRNPLNVLENLQADLAGAIKRAFDLAVLHGRSTRTGQQIPDVEYLNQTKNRVTLGAAAKTEGGIGRDLLTGYDLVVEGDQVNDQFTGFAADHRLRSQLLGAVDTQGRPIFQQSVDLSAGFDNVLGLPTAYGKSISGRVGASADTGVRAFGGDFEALKYGWTDEMTIASSTEATIVDGDVTYHLFQDNLEAYMVEATFGWVISDLKSFVAYDSPKVAKAKASVSS